MDSYLIGISAAVFSFCLGYGFRRLNLKWEQQAKKAERQANMHAEQLQATVSASLDGIIVINSNGEVVDFSDSAERIFGYKRADILGLPMEELIVPKRYRDAHNAGMKRMRDTGKSKILGQRIEIEAMRADGTEFMSELAISRSPSEKGDIFIAYIRDISERIAAQNELVKAKEDAEAASEAKSRFLATMSHEIRTPFNAVLGLLDAIGETKLSAEQLHLVKTAEVSSIALLRIINDVLDYARLSSDQVSIAAHSFQVSSVFDDVLQLFRHQAADKGLAIELIADPDLEEIYLEGDLGRIRQILVNFIGNAIKFTDKGKITLTVKSLRRDDGLYELFCSVEDTGIGIETKNLDMLFNEFYMTDSSETREFGGTGLGLAISKELAELMGGKIGCDSIVGKGSTFWVKFFLPKSSPQKTNVRYKKHDIKMENCRILVAEDNLTNQMVIRHSLEKRCGKLVVVDNGMEVLDVLKHEEFDLILMDIFMPKMNGKEATQIIRASNHSFQNIPIIALTAMGSFQDLEELKAVGIDEVVTKPFKKEDLFSAIGSLLGNRSKPKSHENLEFGGFANQLDADEISVFCEQLRTDLTEIHKMYLEAFERKTWEKLARPSHTLKGLSGTYGMTALSEMAEQMNDIVLSEAYQKCPELAESIIKSLSHYLSSLDGLFEDVKKAA